MRPIEIILVAAVLITLGSAFIPASKRPRWLLFLPALTVLIAVIQLIIEQYRWQMVPAYFLTAVFFLMSIPLLRQQPAAVPVSAGCRRRIVRLVGFALALSLWAVAVVVPTLMPVPRLPEPNGSYAIGTHTFEWVDNARLETLGPDPNSHRDLVIQVWYPAEKITDAKPTPFWPETLGAAYAEASGLPSFVLDHLALAPSHSYLDAPVAQDQQTYPVLIFSQGYDSFINQNTVQMEELASQGYVVFSVAHPYEAIATVYPDGRVVPISEAQLRQINSVDAKALQAAEEQFKQATDTPTSERAVQQYLAITAPIQPSLKTWTDDMIFVMDEIERLDRGEMPSLLSGHLNLDQIGLFGHSFGGAAAATTCLLDKRCKAAANLDGIQYDDLLGQSMSQPFLMMYGGDWFLNQLGENINDVIYNRGHNQFYRLEVKDALHTNYTDAPLMSPFFKMISVAGSIDGYRMETIMNHYLVAFFDKYLKGIDSHALNGPDALYPEVDFQVH